MCTSTPTSQAVFVYLSVWGWGSGLHHDDGPLAGTFRAFRVGQAGGHLMGKQPAEALIIHDEQHATPVVQLMTQCLGTICGQRIWISLISRQKLCKSLRICLRPQHQITTDPVQRRNDAKLMSEMRAWQNNGHTCSLQLEALP